MIRGTPVPKTEIKSKDCGPGHRYVLSVGYLIKNLLTFREEIRPLVGIDERIYRSPRRNGGTTGSVWRYRSF